MQQHMSELIGSGPHPEEFDLVDSRGLEAGLQAVLDGVPPTGVATLKVRKGAFDALNKGSGALGKVK